MNRKYSLEEAQRWLAWIEDTASHEGSAHGFKARFGLTLGQARPKAKRHGIVLPLLERVTLTEVRGGTVPAIPVPRLDGGPRPATREAPFRARGRRP